MKNLFKVAAASACIALTSTGAMAALVSFDFQEEFNSARFIFDSQPSDFDVTFVGTGGDTPVSLLGSSAYEDSGRFVIETKVAGLFNSITVPDTANVKDVEVQVTSMPVPASAALLLAGVGAFAYMRRKKA